MQNKLTIGDRVITTRYDGEIGTVADFRMWHSIEQALIEFENAESRWIGVAYLTLEVTPIESSESQSDVPNGDKMAVFSEF
jgi:hypothetical protein